MQAIGKIVKKFKETGVATNIESPVHHRFTRSAENIAILSERPECVNSSSYSGIRTVLRHIMAFFHLDLHLHPFKVQLTQQLKSAKNSQRRRYVE